jgi:hypothetical protein
MVDDTINPSPELSPSNFRSLRQNWEKLSLQYTPAGIKLPRDLLEERNNNRNSHPKMRMVVDNLFEKNNSDATTSSPSSIPSLKVSEVKQKYEGGSSSVVSPSSVLHSILYHPPASPDSRSHKVDLSNMEDCHDDLVKATIYSYDLTSVEKPPTTHTNMNCTESTTITENYHVEVQEQESVEKEEELEQDAQQEENEKEGSMEKIALGVIMVPDLNLQTIDKNQEFLPKQDRDEQQVVMEKDLLSSDPDFKVQEMDTNQPTLKQDSDMEEELHSPHDSKRDSGNGVIKVETNDDVQGQHEKSVTDNISEKEIETEPPTQLKHSTSVNTLSSYDPDNFQSCGKILVRISRPSLVTKYWHKAYYVIKGESILMVFGSEKDFVRWNKSTKGGRAGTRKELSKGLKFQIDFKEDMKWNPEIECYRMTKISSKDYEGEFIHNIKIECVSKSGSIRKVGAFGSYTMADMTTFKARIQNCLSCCTNY